MSTKKSAPRKSAAPAGMNSSPPKRGAARPPTKVRRTQAERSADTRKRVIEAAIAILAERGYSAATLEAIWTRAGVSQGALTHQFSSKVDIMTAIVDHVFRQDMEYYSRELQKFATERERTIGMIDLAWNAFSSPGGLAVLQIMMAVAGDDELKKRLPAEMTYIQAQANEIRRPGLRLSRDERSMLDAAVVLHRAALRGIVIEMLSGTNPSKIGAARRLLKDYTAHFYDDLSAMAEKSPQ